MHCILLPDSYCVDPTGTLLRGHMSDKVYVILDDRLRHHVPEPISGHGYQSDKILHIPLNEVNDIPEGLALPVKQPPSGRCVYLWLLRGLMFVADPPGSLIRAVGTPHVFFIGSGGRRRHVQNGLSMKGYGFAWSNIKDIPAAELEQIALGQPLPTKHPCPSLCHVVVVAKWRVDPIVYRRCTRHADSRTRHSTCVLHRRSRPASPRAQRPVHEGLRLLTCQHSRHPRRRNPVDP